MFFFLVRSCELLLSINIVTVFVFYSYRSSVNILVMNNVKLSDRIIIVSHLLYFV